MKDYYSILGLNDTATEEEIKKSYRQLAKQYHPDVNPDGAEKFKDISEAYEVLSDPQKKSQYDNRGKNPFGNMGGDPFDLFNQMFGGRAQQPQRRRAPDKILDISVSIFESYLANSRNINFSRQRECGTCHGKGGDKATCTQCQGKGQIIFKTGTGFFGQTIAQTCPTCKGHGAVYTKVCDTCKGSCTQHHQETISFKLPHGADHGDLFRIRQMGDYFDGSYGDLIIRVNLNETDNYRKEGEDIHYDIVLSLDDIKKGEFEVNHPEGKLTIKIPETFTTQTPLRVKGKGFKRNDIGDFYLNVDLKINRNELEKVLN